MSDADAEADPVGDVDAIAALSDPVRRRLYDYVAGQGREVGRVEAAGAVGVGKLRSLFRRGIPHLLMEGGALVRRHSVPATFALATHAVSPAFTVAAQAVLRPAMTVLHSMLFAMLTMLRAATFARVRGCRAGESEAQRQHDSCCNAVLHEASFPFRG